MRSSEFRAARFAEASPTRGAAYIGIYVHLSIRRRASLALCGIPTVGWTLRASSRLRRAGRLRRVPKVFIKLCAPGFIAIAITRCDFVSIHGLSFAVKLDKSEEARWKDNIGWNTKSYINRNIDPLRFINWWKHGLRAAQLNKMNIRILNIYSIFHKIQSPICSDRMIWLLRNKRCVKLVSFFFFFKFTLVPTRVLQRVIVILKIDDGKLCRATFASYTNVIERA